MCFLQMFGIACFLLLLLHDLTAPAALAAAECLAVLGLDLVQFRLHVLLALRVPKVVVLFAARAGGCVCVCV